MAVPRLAVPMQEGIQYPAVRSAWLPELGGFVVTDAPAVAVADMLIIVEATMRELRDAHHLHGDDRWNDPDTVRDAISAAIEQAT